MTRLVLALFLLFAALCARAAGIDFNRDVRPILSDACFQCHGPDEKHRMAGLRLDTKEGAFAETRRGKVIVPGDPGKSLIIQRINHADPARRMPPPASGRTLTAKEIETLRTWVEQGAEWQTHWAFVPPKRPELPPGDAPNPIDRFIDARLKREGLTPNKEADRAKLLRRLSLDLTGLPPTPEEVEAFVKDKSPDAYEKQVDRLLASPHYGERMAMDWLDVARYADTHGYHIDSHRDMWPWRDWVIDAFNRNMPFDKFTILQLAGDLLPEAGLEGKIASGFNRNHMINFEGGAIPEEYLVEYVADRVETTATAWMGLTMGCARCHSHKYDPISQKDYYSFFAFFNNVDEKGLDGKTGNAQPILKLPTPEQEKEQKRLETAIQEAEKVLESDEVARGLAEWRKTLTAQPVPVIRDGLTAHYGFDGSFADISGAYQHGRTLRGDPVFVPGQVGRAVSFDAQTVVSLGRVGALKVDQPFTVAFWLQPTGSKQSMPVLQKIADSSRRGWEVRLEEFDLFGIQQRHARLAFRLISQWPDAVLELRTRERLKQSEWYHVAIVSDGSGKAPGITVYVNGEPVSAEVVRDALSGAIDNDAELRIGVKEPDAKAFAGGLDDLRFYSRALPPDQITEIAVHHPIRALLSGLSGKPSAAEEQRIRTYYLRRVAPEPIRRTYAQLLDLKEQFRRLDKRILSTMVMSELEKPRETFILARGDYRNRTEKVEPNVPSVLPPLPRVDGRPNRLALARWLVDPGHPLTARVAVNRFWQMYFGTGLVKTSENFGSQGEPPSHPELLDWLATEFIRTGWDVKAMQRLIVTSAAYRRSSHVTPELLAKDPENRLLARGPRHRLQAEIVRDNALAVSGLLNKKRGGPGVFPYQPPGIWEELAYGDGFSMQTYVQSHGEDLYRRSLYTFWKRTAPPAQLVTFDAPDREKCTARRSTTNTPLQALVLMNDPTYVEASRALAQRVLNSGKRSVADRAKMAFELATARPPSKAETAELIQLAVKELQHYRKSPKEALALLDVGESPWDKKLKAEELAAWTVVCSAILNLDETISKE